MAKIDQAENIRKLQEQLCTYMGVDMTFFQSDASDEELLRVIARDMFANVKSRIAQKLSIVETAIFFHIDHDRLERAMVIIGTLFDYMRDIVTVCLAEEGVSDEIS